MRLQDTSCFTAIECAEGAKTPSEIQILRVGKFKHPSYGKFDITPLILSDMKKNFDERVRGIDLALDYFHDSDREASGWIKELVLKENNSQLWARVDWTPTAAKKLSDRELRYFSPDFTFKWVDPESGKSYDNVLFGGGLTNRPFVKDMQAIVATENKGDLKMNEEQIKELEATNLKLSEEAKKLADMMPEKDAQISDLQKQIDEIKVQLSAALGQVEVEMKEKVALQDQMKCQEKEQEFSKLLSEGKAVAAQKEAFFKGDMAEFVKLAQPLNLKASGSGKGAEDGDSDDKVMKLAEQIRKEEGLDLGTSISKALKQIKGEK